MFNRYFLIDISYLTFVVANSAFKTYDYEYNLPLSKLGPEYDPTLDDEFNYIFEEAMENRILNSVKNVFPLVDTRNIIICEDCKRDTIWRRGIYPQYKMNRDIKDKSKDKFNLGCVFKYSKEYVLPKLIEKLDCIKVNSPCAEGDDVIAVTTEFLLNENVDNKVVIITSDRDMIQLCQDRVTIATIDGTVRDPRLDMEKLLKKSIDKNINFGAKEFITAKIITGDTGDNIPNIQRGYGLVKAFKLVTEPGMESLKKLLLEDQLIKDKFTLNSKLISFKFIPQDIKESIIEEINNQRMKRDNNG
jgi:5'-3' exonuclease